jgi:hypothetical protein
MKINFDKIFTGRVYRVESETAKEWGEREEAVRERSNK